jgi:hypothetical protein
MVRLEDLGAPLERYLQFRIRFFVILYFFYIFFWLSVVFQKEIGLSG